MMSVSRKRFAAFSDKILGKNLSFQHIIFLCSAVAGIILSATGSIGNWVMELSPISIIIPAINLFIDIACVVYSIVMKRWKGAAIVMFFFASFVLFPFLWFTTGGTMSSSLPLVIGLGVVLAIVFQGKVRMAFFASTLLLYSVLIIIELHVPNNFIPYPNREAWYIDVLIGFSLGFLASGGLAYFTVTKYNASRQETKKLLAELKQTAITDPLTGVFNRRHLMARIDEEMRKAFDDNTPLTLCIIDIDHFKRINDNYGHLYGDEVLVKLSATIVNSLDGKGIFGRYGGEEFVAIFPGSDMEMAREIVGRFCEALRQVEWAHGEPITISGGVSEYVKGLHYSKFLENADEKLYTSKQSGRNRIGF